MIQIIKQEIEMEEGLKQRLEFICQFCKTKPTFINGSIRKIDKTTLSGTTSKGNNAIQNAAGLTKVDNHNCRKTMIEKKILNLLEELIR